MEFTLEQWVTKKYTKQEMKEIAEHGCASGCAHGLIYYKETTEIFDRYEDEILERLSDMEFNISIEDGIAQAKNLAVWVAVEWITQVHTEGWE